jgi:YD repeat-containing protein
VNRLTSISYSDGQTPNVTYAFDGNGNRTSMTDGTGQTTYSYDELDRPTSVTSPGSQPVGYRYDLDGNRRKLIYPDGTSVTYNFHNGDQLTSLADWANRSTSYTYFPDGQLQQVHKREWHHQCLCL